MTENQEQETEYKPNFASMQECQIQLKRNERNQLLEMTDRYLLSDYPISDEKREQIRAYRQALRDYFARDDVKNWVFTFENQYLPDFPEMPI
jgi:hypothetical protein